LGIAAWEIAELGFCHLGKCHLGSHPWKNVFGKIPNTKDHKPLVFEFC